MDVCNHVAGSVPNGGVGVGIGVVEDPKGCILGLFGGHRLLVREGSNGNEHGRVNGDDAIE